MAPSQSRRVRQTCIVCRDRKVKCDRAQPKCGRCVRLKERCSYDTLPVRATVSRQVQDLDARLDQAETRSTTDIHFPMEIPSLLDNLDFGPLMPPTADMLSFEGLPDNNGGNMSLVNHQFGDTHPDFMKAYGPLEGNPIMQSGQMHQVYMDTCLDWQTPTAISADTQFMFEGMPEHGFTSSNGDRTQLSGLEARTKPSDENLTILHHFFFDSIHPSLPILCETRFFDELNVMPQSQPLLALQYAVGTLGAALSPCHEHVPQRYYGESRKYLEMCEIDEDEAQFANLHVFQALLLLLRYEIMASKITRAWMTLGRAIRLSSVLNLHKLDDVMPVDGIVSGLHVKLPSTTDPVILEERRRSFWCLFILETYVKTRSGMSCQLGQSCTFEVNLPSPGPLSPDFTPVEMPFLKNVNNARDELSSYAACVVMVDLAIKCYEHAEDRGSESQGQGFWDRHFTLTKLIRDRSTMMQSHLSTEAACLDPIALTTNLNLRAVEVHFYEGAVKKAKNQGVSSSMHVENELCCMAATRSIVDTIQAVWRTQLSERNVFTLQAIFTAWPIAKAINALTRDLKESGIESVLQTVNELRLLYQVLDHVERDGNHWHLFTARALAELGQWDKERSIML